MITNLTSIYRASSTWCCLMIWKLMPRFLGDLLVMIFRRFQRSDAFVEDTDLYEMNVSLLNVYRKEYELLSLTAPLIPPDIEDKFIPISQFVPDIENLLFLSLTGAFHATIQDFAGNSISNGPRKSIAISQERKSQQTPMMVQSPHSPMNVQRRVSFNPVNESMQ